MLKDNVWSRIKNIFVYESVNETQIQDVERSDRFTRSKNIVIDNKTNLMWQDAEDINHAVSWYEASEIAKRCRIGDFNDWRVPSIDELKSICDKNSYEKLNAIFEYRPFVLWTNMLDKDGYAATLFFDNNIVAEIISEYTNPNLQSYCRLVRNINKNTENLDYETNINTLTCNCKNWLFTRSDFQNNDPRRLCKHLIQKLDENNLVQEVFKYKDNILFYKSKNKGFRDDFNHLIEIPNTGCTLLYKYEFEWMSLFDEDGNKYGFMIGGNGNFSWSKETKPASSNTIELFFTKSEYLLPIDLLKEEIDEIIKVISGKYKILQENNHGYSSIANIYDIVNEDGDYRDAGTVNVSNEKIDIRLYGSDNGFTLIRDKIIIEQKLEERLIKIKSGNYWETTYLKFNTEIEERNKGINKFLTTSLMLNYYKSVKTNHFNKILEKMNFIKKIDSYNNSKWILIGNGLKYGINFQKSYVGHNSIEIPDWYIISKFDDYTKEYKIDTSSYQIYYTEILWNKEMFKELLDLVTTYSKPKEKVVSKKQTEREEWLQFVECPHCASKNIHKKNKRTYGYGEVQRYQCMDCKKIFQEVLSNE